MRGTPYIQPINARAVSIIRYGAGIVEQKENELEAIDRKSRKLLTMNRRVHPRTYVDRFYWKRKSGGQGLISVEGCVRMLKNKSRFLPERTRTTTNRSSN